MGVVFPADFMNTLLFDWELCTNSDYPSNSIKINFKHCCSACLKANWNIFGEMYFFILLPFQNEDNLIIYVMTIYSCYSFHVVSAAGYKRPGDNS